MAEFLEECFVDRGRSIFGGACIGKGEFQQPNCLVFAPDLLDGIHRRIEKPRLDG